MISYASETGFIIYCWYWNNEKKRELKVFSKEALKETGGFSKLTRIYLTIHEMDIAGFMQKTEGDKVYNEPDAWKNLWEKNELIEISDIVDIADGRIHCTLAYSTQCSDAAKKVITKSTNPARRTRTCGSAGYGCFGKVFVSGYIPFVSPQKGGVCTLRRQSNEFIERIIKFDKWIYEHYANADVSLDDCMYT
jgi:hypothetical protein